MRTFVFISLSLIIGHFAKASTVYQCDGREMSKGGVVKTKINNPKAKCTVTDDIKIDEETGAVKKQK